MDELEVTGLVIREVATGEADKVLTLLTAEEGKLSVTAKRAANLRDKHAPSAQLFAYSTLLLRRTGKYYYIVDSSLIEPFLSLRNEIERLSLAVYLGDVASDLTLEETPDETLLSLILNALYALDRNREIPLWKVKGAFEMKAAALSGFMPETETCGRCGEPLTGEAGMDVMDGRMFCVRCMEAARKKDRRREKDRREEARSLLRVPEGVRLALRFAAKASVRRFLSFTLDEDGPALFGAICERYLLSHLEHGFSSLDYYKIITDGTTGKYKLFWKREEITSE